MFLPFNLERFHPLDPGIEVMQTLPMTQSMDTIGELPGATESGEPSPAKPEIEYHPDNQLGMSPSFCVPKPHENEDEWIPPTQASPVAKTVVESAPTTPTSQSHWDCANTQGGKSWGIWSYAGTRPNYERFPYGHSRIPTRFQGQGTESCQVWCCSSKRSTKYEASCGPATKATGKKKHCGWVSGACCCCCEAEENRKGVGRRVQKCCRQWLWSGAKWWWGAREAY